MMAIASIDPNLLAIVMSVNACMHRMIGVSSTSYFFQAPNVCYAVLKARYCWKADTFSNTVMKLSGSQVQHFH